MKYDTAPLTLHANMQHVMQHISKIGAVDNADNYRLVV